MDKELMDAIQPREYSEYCKAFPIRQNTSNGLYGWQRWGDGFDLNAASYTTEAKAEVARKYFFEQGERSDAAMRSGNVRLAFEIAGF
jgi:hypothetical protein